MKLPHQICAITVNILTFILVAETLVRLFEANKIPWAQNLSDPPPAANNL